MRRLWGPGKGRALEADRLGVKAAALLIVGVFGELPSSLGALPPHLWAEVVAPPLRAAARTTAAFLAHPEHSGQARDQQYLFFFNYQLWFKKTKHKMYDLNRFKRAVQSC